MALGAWMWTLRWWSSASYSRGSEYSRWGEAKKNPNSQKRVQSVQFG